MTDELNVSVHLPRLDAIGVATRLRLAALGSIVTAEQADVMRQLADAIDLAEQVASERDRELVNALCAGGELLERLRLDAQPVQGGPPFQICCKAVAEVTTDEKRHLREHLKVADGWRRLAPDGPATWMRGDRKQTDGQFETVVFTVSRVFYSRFAYRPVTPEGARAPCSACRVNVAPGAVTEETWQQWRCPECGSWNGKRGSDE